MAKDRHHGPGPWIAGIVEIAGIGADHDDL
jgi:hypothetical protein